MSLTPQEVDFGEQNVIYITEQPNSEWTRDATEELIKLYDSKIALFEQGIIKTKKSVYEKISSEMAKKHFYYNPSQCENKWKSLKRAFLTRLEKSPVLLKTRPRPFENEVGEILKREKPLYRKHIDSDDSNLFSIDLNKPPGFTKQEIHSEDDEDDDIRKVLMDEDSEMETSTKEEPASLEHSYSFQIDKAFSKSSNGSNTKERLIGEITDFKNIMKRHHDTSISLMNGSNRIQENIGKYLSNLEKNSEEMIHIKRMKLEKQTELIQQMKIQNSLLAKLIQKLG